MPPRLKHIEVENFKSYKGHRIIGPLKPFNAVIGPNGSGKSNFMDAISFVMGEKTQSLRVKRLSDLIHGAAISKPISRSASVAAVFVLDEESGKEICFQRSVQGSSSEYRINGTVVSNNEYLTELEKLRINVKGKNFLVFQGAVESVAMKNPKEMTALFEEISGSGALKEEYDRLKQQMQKAQEEINFAYQKKKGINAERKEARLEKEEADKYSRLKDDLNDKLVEHQLFRLYHNEREMKNLENDLKHKQREVEKIEKKKEKAEEVLKEKKKEQGKFNRELAKIEQDIREVEVEISKKRPQFIKAKERVSHMQKKLDGAIKTLEQARKAHEAHMNDIKKLEDELAEVEKTKDEYESQIAGESQSQGRDVHLEDEQVREYHRLKEEAAKRSARYMQELDSVNREQKSDQDRLDNVSRMRTDAENKHRQKCHEKEEMEKRIEKLAEHIRLSEQALQDQKQLRSDLQSDVGSSKDRVHEIQKQLDDVLEQLGDARTDKHEDARRKKKQEIVERFKSNYPGVYDRMINMCQPIHKRYNVAITKVLGKFMEAIVVDSEHTARQCIKYLKEQMLDPETFLPLDYLQTKPVKERLRNITEPKGVKLLYDVLQFEPQAVAHAVLFATNNALVCETPEDAMKVAYELGGRYDAVALDGTYYQKSGIISGGSLDLARKAKRWDEKHISQLKAQKEKLTEELRDAMKKSRKESELNTVDSQIRGLETRLRYAKTDMESTMKQINAVDAELAKLSDEMEKYGPKIEEIEKTMQTREHQIEEIKLQMNSVEDVVFSKFCQEIGIRNIRQYEDRELRAQEERKQKRLEFQKQINRISSNLEFERSRDTQNNVSRWERTVNDEEERLETCKKQEQKQREEIDKDLQQVEQLKAQRLHKKQEVDGMEEELGKARREVGSIAKDVQAAQKSVVSLETKIEGKKSERHAILMQCKMDDVAIPMIVGNMEDIVASDPSQSSSGDTSSTVQQYEKEARIKIDYNMLSDSLKDLEEKDEIKKMADKLLSSIKSLQDTLTKIQAPNMRAIQKLELAQGKLQSTNEEFENLRKQNKKAKAAFEKMKQQRYERFTRCFDHVSNEIDNIYKALAQNQSAQAFLGAENPEEPYLDGINYNCVAPGKRFQPMSNLSGGEKTVAALALLFAIHSYQPAPFFVLDEVDAALDNTNIGKVAKYIRGKTESLQTIVISLKEEFYSHADSLIGICPQPAECLVSQVLTVDLTKYP
ncbi:structural maintenance of chromosomes protein 1A [Tribolium castaneum]|uniref:Structural maintenance of chromosomes protein n=1 Tax=Tribolium castaneum TaxID=7070 RepID=D6WWY2_TRICA|nr:PREDICTED: structural maintenance of chromosomes protein 1A [Tribolium castaneum]EFA08076.1 Structural maintenance of chromosomes protein 1A-like Protein [Tribolium castaneum]|eukprot:XP_967679.1 PREDICTED: structural maintenance of chromosomes protein 1A [Tribolium castaneum]